MDGENDKVDKIREIDDPDDAEREEGDENEGDNEEGGNPNGTEANPDFDFDDVDPEKKKEDKVGDEVSGEAEGDEGQKEFNEKRDPKVAMENIESKTKSYNLEQYLKETGIPLAFQEIFSELLVKKVKIENYFSYTAMRLRQMNKEIDEIKKKEEGSN